MEKVPRKLLPRLRAKVWQVILQTQFVVVPSIWKIWLFESAVSYDLLETCASEVLFRNPAQRFIATYASAWRILNFQKRSFCARAPRKLDLASSIDSICCIRFASFDYRFQNIGNRRCQIGQSNEATWSCFHLQEHYGLQMQTEQNPGMDPGNFWCRNEGGRKVGNSERVN